MSTEKTISKNPPLVPSRRFTLALLVSFALFVQYAQRVGLSMAIVCMVDRSRMSNRTISAPPKYGSQFLTDKKFLWSEFQQQILLGAYWFGYVFTLVPSKFPID